MFYSALNAVSPYLLQIFIGIIAALVLVAGVQTVRIAWLKKDLQATQAQNEAAATRIAAQNDAIRLWREEGERARRQAKQAHQAAAQVRTASNRRVARIQAEPVPTDCEKASQWAAGKAPVLAEGW